MPWEATWNVTLEQFRQTTSWIDGGCKEGAIQKRATPRKTLGCKSPSKPFKKKIKKKTKLKIIIIIRKQINYKNKNNPLKKK